MLDWVIMGPTIWKWTHRWSPNSFLRVWADLSIFYGAGRAGPALKRQSDLMRPVWVHTHTYACTTSYTRPLGLFSRQPCLGSTPRFEVVASEVTVFRIHFSQNENLKFLHTELTFSSSVAWLTSPLQQALAPEVSLCQLFW